MSKEGGKGSCASLRSGVGSPSVKMKKTEDLLHPTGEELERGEREEVRPQLGELNQRIN